MKQLEGRIIWITGSARRVGKAMALACAREGATIVVHCRSSREEAEETRAEIEALGTRATIVQGDHSKVEDVERMVEEIRRNHGRLDTLVNSAAAFPSKKFEEISVEDFQEIIAANLHGPFLCAQKALPLLRKSSPGRIINLVDWAVKRPYSGYAHYMASKGGLHTLTLALARELAPDILVNGIAPGPVLEPEDISDREREAILKKIPLRRWGTADSIAKTLVYMLTCDDLCGEIITVDAGRSVGG